MTIAFFLKSRFNKDGRKPLGLQFTFSRYNRQQKLLGITIQPKHWDKKNNRVTGAHNGNEHINRTIAEIKHRIENAKTEYENKRLNSDGVISKVLNKTDNSSVEQYIKTQIRDDVPKDGTYDSYLQWWSAFKNMIGASNKSFKIDDLMVEKLYSNAKKIGDKKVKDGEMTTRTYKNYISICQKVLNHAYDNRNVYEKYIIPKRFRTTEIYTKKSKPMHEPWVVYNAIRDLNTIQQWQAVSFWVISFCLRGFYYSDLLMLSDKKVTDKKGRKIVGRQIFNDMYLDTLREKSKINIFVKIPREVLRLITMVKYSLVHTKLNKKLNGKTILADINDVLKFYDYEKDTNGSFHKELWKQVNKKISEKFGFTFMDARQTFNQYAQRVKVDKETREILLGHIGKRTIEEHYDNYKLPEVVDSVNEAHNDVLKAFQAPKLIQLLMDKLNTLISQNNSLPKWLLMQSGVHKVGREYKVLTGFKNHKPVWTNIESKYKWYFKKDQSKEDGYWSDLETWLDGKNKLHSAVYKNLESNKWVKEAKRQQKEIKEAKNLSKELAKNGIQYAKN